MMSIIDALTDLVGRRIQIEDLPGLPSRAEVLEVSRLPSRKNSVYLLRTSAGSFVLKVFESDRWAREYSVLTSCISEGILVPKPMLSLEGFILMEFLAGPNLRDLINQTPDFRYGGKLAEWLSGFHLAFSEGEETLVKSDAKLQNFILTEAGIAGVDFELAHRGSPLEDLGEICSHVLNTDPMFTREKYVICDELLRRYSSLTGHSLNGISSWVVQAMEETLPFRPSQRGRLLQEIEALMGGEVWPFSDRDQNR